MRWIKTPISNLADLVTKGTTPTTFDKAFTMEGVNFIKAEALNGDSSLDPKGFFFIDTETHELLNRSKLQENDVLLTIAGAQIGKCGIVKAKHLPANTNQAVGIIRINKDRAVPNFVYYFFKQKRSFAYIQSLNAQAAQPNINLAMIKRIEIPLPPFTHQKRIAHILSAYDDLIENNRRRIQLLEWAARLLYKEWFVYLRFPGHEHAKIRDGVPEGWKKIRLGDKILLNYGNTLKAIDRVDGEYPVYGSSGIIGSHVKPLVKGPGIIVGRKGNVGSVFWSAKDFYPIDTVYYIDSESCNYYLYNSLKSLQFINSDGAVPGLNRKYAHSLPYLMPLKRVHSLFEKTVEPMYELIEKLKEYNVKLKQARDILLPRLMNGEISV